MAVRAAEKGVMAFRIKLMRDGSFSSLIAIRLFVRYCPVWLRDDSRITKDATIVLPL